MGGAQYAPLLQGKGAGRGDDRCDAGVRAAESQGLGSRLDGHRVARGERQGGGTQGGPVLDRDRGGALHIAQPQLADGPVRDRARRQLQRLPR